PAQVLPHPGRVDLEAPRGLHHEDGGKAGDDGGGSDLRHRLRHGLRFVAERQFDTDQIAAHPTATASGAAARISARTRLAPSTSERSLAWATRRGRLMSPQSVDSPRCSGLTTSRQARMRSATPSAVSISTDFTSMTPAMKSFSQPPFCRAIRSPAPLWAIS